MSAATKQRNRDAMPQTAAIVDEFRGVFGRGVRVRWAREGELEVGRRVDGERSMSSGQWLHYVKTGEKPA